MFKIRDIKHAQMISNGGKDVSYEYLDNISSKKRTKTSDLNAKLGSLGKMFGK